MKVQLLSHGSVLACWFAPGGVPVPQRVWYHIVCEAAFVTFVFKILKHIVSEAAIFNFNT
jgi:hypothetical protein